MAPGPWPRRRGPDWPPGRRRRHAGGRVQAIDHRGHGRRRLHLLRRAGAGDVDDLVDAGLAVRAHGLHLQVADRQALDAAGLLQVGDLGLQQADALLLDLDLALDGGDLGALAAGHGLGQVDAQDQHHQQAGPHQVDEPEAPDPAREEAHAASFQTGASVRTAARSFAERARGLALASASDGDTAPLNNSRKLGSVRMKRRSFACLPLDQAKSIRAFSTRGNAFPLRIMD